MLLKQIYLGCLAQASYLIADEKTGEAAIVDPRRDIDIYLEEAEARGFTIKYVFLTHFHADYVSGHLELRERTGARIVMGKTAEPEFSFLAMGDGDSVRMGDVRLSVLETPGHTPESICVLVYDTAGSDTEPHAVLTGDTLFIGDVGRPDLMASIGITAEDLAGQLYDSTRNKLLALPDATLVYPGHGAGSMCGKNLSTDTVSTIGKQRRLNAALQPMSKEEFVRMVTEDQPPAPAYFAYDAVMNRKERPTLETSLEASLVGLSPDRVLSHRDSGGIILDVRDPETYSKGYIRGSINIGLDGSYAIWAGTVLDRSAPVVLVAEPGAEREAAIRLGRIGFDHVTGYLEGGFEAFPPDSPERESVHRYACRELSDARGRLVILDVRNPGERETKHIAGTLFVPLNRLNEEMASVPRGKKIVVHCARGYRSSIAASLLRMNGYEDVTDLIGGIEEWQREGLDLEVAAPA